MKEKVILFFRDLPNSEKEQFEIAIQLYCSLSNRNYNYERVLRSSGFSKQNLSNLLYDLKTLSGVTNSDIRKAKMKIIDVQKNDSEFNLRKFVEENDKETVEKRILEATYLNNEFEYLILNDAFVNKFESKDPSDVSFDTKTLREEFPFLNDVNCPNELKILVSDKITAWNTYKEAHVKIQKAIDNPISNEELAALGEIATTAFVANQQIYDELIHYKETGKILGKHPIYMELSIEREVSKMTPEELINFKNSSVKYLAENNKKLETATEVNKEKIENKINIRKIKLSYVNKKLGVNGK